MLFICLAVQFNSHMGFSHAAILNNAESCTTSAKTRRRWMQLRKFTLENLHSFSFSFPGCIKGFEDFGNINIM